MSNKILFVEDEEDLTLIVADTLRGQGYDVITAADGIQGLEKFKSEGADIVVADVMMPKMDGFTMAKEIRKLSPTVPLLFLTAKSKRKGNHKKEYRNNDSKHLRKYMAGQWSHICLVIYTLVRIDIEAE